MATKCIWFGLHSFLVSKISQNLRAVFNIGGLFEAVKNNVGFAHPLSIREFDPKYHQVDFLHYNLNTIKPLDPLVV